MTEDVRQYHLAIRRAKMEAFIANPESYKVCCLCRSISLECGGLCPVCGAYRFTSDRETVIETAKIIGSNPFPLTAGVVPRIDGFKPYNLFSTQGRKSREQ